MDALSDKHLLESCLAGQQTHCKMIYERYKKLVVHLIRGFFRDPETIRDQAQEVFLKVFSKAGTFRWESTFKTWLSTVTVNHCISQLSAMERRKWRSHDSIDDPENPIDINDPEEYESLSPHRQLEKKELYAAIDKLPKKQRVTLLMSIAGYSYEEIAEITGAAFNTVGTRIYYAKKKLID